MCWVTLNRSSPQLELLDVLMTYWTKSDEWKWRHMIGDVVEWLSSCLPPFTIVGDGTKDRGSWLVEPCLWKICGLWAQMWTSCWFIMGEKGTWLSSVEGQMSGFTVDHPELLPRPRPPRWDEALQCEATQAAPSNRNPSCSVSYKPLEHLSALLGQKITSWNLHSLKKGRYFLTSSSQLWASDKWIQWPITKQILLENSATLSHQWLVVLHQTNNPHGLLIIRHLIRQRR